MIGAPSVSGLKGAAIDYGLGMGGFLLTALSAAMFGSGFWGGLAGAALAGSVIKGTRGTVIATVLGFNALAGFNSAPAAQSTNTRGVM